MKKISLLIWITELRKVLERHRSKIEKDKGSDGDDSDEHHDDDDKKLKRQSQA